MPPRWPSRRARPAAPVEVTGDRVLVAGMFSWPNMATTAGDLLARDVACEWVREAGRELDVANAPEYGPAFDWREADPARYADVVFVCGPTDGSGGVDDLLQRFGGSRRIGLDLTMLRPLAEWNPFDLLIERDSDRAARPDIVLAAPTARVPVIGVVLVEPYTPEYPEHDRQPQARAAIERLLHARPAARVAIDTRLAPNEHGLRSPDEVESLIARMDAVVTTRLHGLVLALKNGVPALAVDPVAGGAKITHQARALGWPAVRDGGALDPAELERLLDWCLSAEGRERARECAQSGRDEVQRVRAELVAALRR